MYHSEEEKIIMG